MIVEISLHQEDLIDSFKARQISYDMVDKTVRIECPNSVDMLGAYGEALKPDLWVYIIPMSNVRTLTCW